MKIVATLNPCAVEIHSNGKSIATIRSDWPNTNGWALVMPSHDGATSVSYDIMAVACKFIEDTSGLNQRG